VRRVWGLALAAGLLWGAAPAADAQPKKPDFDRTAAALQQPEAKRRAEAVDDALARANAAPALVLLMASVAAVSAGRVEEAGFLFYAGQLRMRVDLKRFEPAGQGSEHPSVLLGAMMQTAGQVVNPEIMGQPVRFAAALTRLEAWDAVGPPGYDPGWRYTKAMPEKEGRVFAQEHKSSYMTQARGISTLLNDPEYFVAYRALMDIGKLDFKEQIKPESLQKKSQAEKRLREIEEKKGIEALFYRKPAGKAK